MVYVASDGSIVQSAPWNLDRISKLFYGTINFVVLFFKTLVGLDGGSATSGGSRPSGSSSYRGSGGGGSGPWRPGGGGGGKKFMTLKDVNPPTIGGCPGGACGR